MVVLDPNCLRERDLDIDLEIGVNATTSEQEGSEDIVSSVGQATNLSNSVWRVFVSVDGLIKSEEAVNSENSFFSSVESPLDNGECIVEQRFVGEEKVPLLEKKMVAEKPKMKGCKKPPKPPRPPKSPLLDAADQKLIQDKISELAMLKRARIERMKALRKTKNAKAASSNSNLCALVITMLFCLVMIWQGLLSRSSSSVSFQGSGSRDGIISVQFYNNISTSGPYASSSASPNIIEQVSGLDGHGEGSKVAG